MSYNVAVVGATGTWAAKCCRSIDEREFPVNEVHAIASRRSVGTEVSFGDKTLKCKDLADVRLLQGRLRDHVGRRHRLEGVEPEDRRDGRTRHR